MVQVLGAERDQGYEAECEAIAFARPEARPVVAAVIQEVGSSERGGEARSGEGDGPRTDERLVALLGQLPVTAEREAERNGHGVGGLCAAEEVGAICGSDALEF